MYIVAIIEKYVLSYLSNKASPDVQLAAKLSSLSCLQLNMAALHYIPYLLGNAHDQCPLCYAHEFL